MIENGFMFSRNDALKLTQSSKLKNDINKAPVILPPNNSELLVRLDICSVGNDDVGKH